MWPQYNQYLPFGVGDPRMYPQLYAPINHMYEDKIKSNGEKRSKSIICVQIEETPSRNAVLIGSVDTNEEKPKTDLEDGQSEDLQEADFDSECIYNDLRRERYMVRAQDLMGMTVTSGSVVLSKDEKNLIGISIGGGAPLCPCLYIVQIFDNTPASREGTLQSGDELVGVNGQSVKGKTKVEVAKMIQAAKETVTINYNKLHADPKQGKTLDIIMKKMKHRLVENMSSGAADALGLSRAILCNDTLVAKLKELRDTETMYKRLVEHAKRMLKAHFDLSQSYTCVGDMFSCVGVREPQPRASEAFTKLGQAHRALAADTVHMLKALKPILADMGTYLNKAIPDTKLTIRKYADTKFEYLSYCLKVKEMDDEEYGYNALQEPLYRVETGNYEYRLILRCRQDARARFARLRSDVLVKMELLDNKKTQDVAFQLKRFIEGLAVYNKQAVEHLTENATLFPVEVDLSQNAFQYKSTTPFIQDSQEEDEEVEYGKEIQENYDVNENENREPKLANRMQNKDKNKSDDASEQLLPGLSDAFGNNDTFGNSDAFGNSDGAKPDVDNLTLLTELGLADTNVAEDFGDFQNGLMDEFMPKSNAADTDDVFDKLLSELSGGN